MSDPGQAATLSTLHGSPTVMGPACFAAIEAAATPNSSTSVLARLNLLLYLVAALSMSAEDFEVNSFTPVQNYVPAQEISGSSTRSPSYQEQAGEAPSERVGDNHPIPPLKFGSIDAEDFQRQSMESAKNQSQQGFNFEFSFNKKCLDELSPEEV